MICIRSLINVILHEQNLLVDLASTQNMGRALCEGQTLIA